MSASALEPLFPAPAKAKTSEVSAHSEHAHAAASASDAQPKAKDKKKKKNSLASALKLVLGPVAVVVAVPIVAVAAPIMYARNPFIIKSLKRDLHFVKCLKGQQAYVAALKEDNNDEYNVADLWENTLKTKVPSMEKTFMTFLDKNIKGARIVTYLEMETSANRIANWALSVGLTAGNTAALMMNNQPEYIMVWLGMAKIGVSTALMNPCVQGKGLDHSITLVKAKVVIYGSDLQANMDTISGEAANVPSFVMPAPEDVDTITADNLLDMKLQSADAIPRSARDGVKLLDHAFQVMTSGTTGLPKAAVVNNTKYTGSAQVLVNLYKIKKTDSVYIALPLCHSSANQIGVGITIFMGISCVVRRKFSATFFIEDCAKYDVSVAQYIGELCRYVVATPPSKFDRAHKLRLIVGNGLRPEVWQQVIDRFNIPQVGEFYASTEGNANTFNVDSTFGSVGFISDLLAKIYPVRFLRIDPISGDIVRDPVTLLCVQCGVDEPGELVGLVNMDDPTRRFDGYTDKSATKKKLVYDVEKKGDVFFRTGDILRKDKRGNIFFCDRIGDTFRWKGENVSTTEVTQVVSVVPGVSEANVYGAEIPNHDGRAGMVCITFSKGVTVESFNWSALEAECKRDLAMFARPVFVRISPTIEVTGTFKHKKVELRNEGADPSASEDKVFYFDSVKRKYELLTPKIYEKICKGEIKI